MPQRCLLFFTALAVMHASAAFAQILPRPTSTPIPKSMTVTCSISFTPGGTRTAPVAFPTGRTCTVAYNLSGYEQIATCFVKGGETKCSTKVPLPPYLINSPTIRVAESVLTSDEITKIGCIREKDFPKTRFASTGDYVAPGITAEHRYICPIYMAIQQ